MIVCALFAIQAAAVMFTHSESMMLIPDAYAWVYSMTCVYENLSTKETCLVK